MVFRITRQNWEQMGLQKHPLKICSKYNNITVLFLGETAPPPLLIPLTISCCECGICFGVIITFLASSLFFLNYDDMLTVLLLLCSDLVTNWDSAASTALKLAAAKPQHMQCAKCRIINIHSFRISPSQIVVEEKLKECATKRCSYRQPF